MGGCKKRVDDDVPFMLRVGDFLMVLYGASHFPWVT